MTGAPGSLSSDWAEDAAGLTALLPAADDASGTVSLSFSTGPRKEVGFHWSYQAGRPAAGDAGVDAEADLVLGLASADAADVLSGRVAPSVAFMRGRLKASGDGALLLAVLRSSAGGGFDTWRAAMAGVFPVP